MTQPNIRQEQIVTAAMLERLPAVVQRYLIYTGIVGSPSVETVRLSYSGRFRLGADKGWMPIDAQQTYTTNPPAFRWRARFKMAGLPLMNGDDTYQGGQAHMFGKLAGLFTVFDARSEALILGAMMRYLQEMMWFPAAYLNDYITWQAVDDHAADVSLTDAGRTVGGRMYFDDAGRLLSFTARRYKEDRGSFTLETWAAPVTAYARMAGLNLPIWGQGVWHLAAGDLPYVDITLRDLAYNVPIEPIEAV